MRMRKKKWVDPFIEEENRYIVKDVKPIGHWHEEYSKDKLYLEIGMGMGDFITQRAFKNPDILYVGFEKVTTCVAKSVIKAEELEIDNFRVILDNADNLEEYFNDEVDRIYLHFSDPWPKKAHAKRRLTRSKYLNIYRKVLKADGEIIFKTDNKDLFEFSIPEFINNGFKMTDLSVDYHRRENDDILTGYETKFKEMGQPIYFAKFIKC